MVKVRNPTKRKINIAFSFLCGRGCVDEAVDVGEEAGEAEGQPGEGYGGGTGRRLPNSGYASLGSGVPFGLET